MPKRLTKKITYITLPEKRIAEIEDLVASWSHETKEFMRARLNQYKPPTGLPSQIVKLFKKIFNLSKQSNFVILKEPNILTDWQRRFELSGETVPRKAWNNILEKEVNNKDHALLLSLLNKELSDVRRPGRRFSGGTCSRPSARRPPSAAAWGV